MRKVVLTLALGAITLPWAFAQTGAMGKSATGKAPGTAKTFTHPRRGTATKFTHPRLGSIGSANRMVNPSGAAANKAKLPAKPSRAKPLAQPK
jgi:hypothetical protein